MNPDQPRAAGRWCAAGRGVADQPGPTYPPTAGSEVDATANPLFPFGVQLGATCAGAEPPDLGLRATWPELRLGARVLQKVLAQR